MMQESFQAALAALAMAVIFIYLILASQFGSFLQPLAIMASLPFTLIGVFLALLITGSTLNIFSIIGIIMLMGLVTKNAILLVDFTNQGLREGKSRHDAILDAGQVRLRPILMTTMAMIFGMLPMAIGHTDGGESNAPMGRAVIGGVITSTLLTLIVVPVIYTYLDTWGRKVKARPQFLPSRTAIDPGIIGAFLDQQERLVKEMKATRELELERITITSPILSLITYSLMDAYRIIVVHEQNHFVQARRVLEAPGFPT